MLKIRTAKLVAALSVLLVPWNGFAFGQNLGWGLGFSFGRYVDTVAGTQFLTMPDLLGIAGQFDPQSRVGLYLWAAMFPIAVLGVVAALGSYYDGSVDRGLDRLAGACFIVAGGGFVVSRFFLYEYLLVSPQSSPNWFAVPVGALYVAFVGVVFYRDRWRAGVTIPVDPDRAMQAERS